MAKKLIWRSDAGQRAWENLGSGLPRGYRRILDLIDAPMPEATVLAALQGFEPKEIRRWIDELDTLCFIHVSSLDESNDPLARKAA